MYQSDILNSLVKDIMSRFGGQDGESSKKENTQKHGSEKSKISITPSQALVIAGILGGVLEVDSVLVDKAQTIEIVLTGTLKQKTQLEKVMAQVGSMPFEEVMKAMMGNLT